MTDRCGCGAKSGETHNEAYEGTHFQPKSDSEKCPKCDGPKHQSPIAYFDSFKSKAWCYGETAPKYGPDDVVGFTNRHNGTVIEFRYLYPDIQAALNSLEKGKPEKERLKRCENAAIGLMDAVRVYRENQTHDGLEKVKYADGSDAKLIRTILELEGGLFDTDRLLAEGAQ